MLTRKEQEKKEEKKEKYIPEIAHASVVDSESTKARARPSTFSIAIYPMLLNVSSPQAKSSRRVVYLYNLY